MSISKHSVIFIGLAIGSMFLLAACGGSDSDSAPDSNSAAASTDGGSSIVAAQPTLESEAVGDDVATPEPERDPPPAVSVVLPTVEATVG